VSKHVFLPSIGHVGQPKTSELASAGGGCDKVYGSITRAVTFFIITQGYGVAFIGGEVCSRSSLAMGRVIIIVD